VGFLTTVPALSDDAQSEPIGANSCATSKAIIDYLSAKYSSSVAGVGLAIGVAIVSSQIDELAIGFNLLIVAPSRHFKSQLVNELRHIIDPGETIVHICSKDVTAHGLYRETHGDVDNKCMVYDDLTVTLASKDVRTATRLICMNTDLMDRRQYDYRDNIQEFTIRGRMTFIGCMTTPSYKHRKTTFEELTLLPRLTVSHHEVPYIDLDTWEQDRIQRNRMSYTGPPIQIVQGSLDLDTVFNVDDWGRDLHEAVNRWTAFSGRPPNAVGDQIRSFLAGHMILNGRTQLVKEDFDYLMMCEPLFSLPTTEARINTLRMQGMRPTNIARTLGITRAAVSQHLKNARARGLNV